MVASLVGFLFSFFFQGNAFGGGFDRSVNVFKLVNEISPFNDDYYGKVGFETENFLELTKELKISKCGIRIF